MKKRIMILIALLATLALARPIIIKKDFGDRLREENQVRRQEKALRAIESELRQMQPIQALWPSKPDWIQLEINQSILERLAGLERQSLLYGNRITSLEQKVKVLQQRDWKRK